MKKLLIICFFFCLVTNLNAEPLNLVCDYSESFDFDDGNMTPVGSSEFTAHILLDESDEPYGQATLSNCKNCTANGSNSIIDILCIKYVEENTLTHSLQIDRYSKKIETTVLYNSNPLLLFHGSCEKVSKAF